MQPLDPAIKTVWMIKSLLVWSSLCLAALGYDVVRFFSEDRFLPFGLLSGFILLVGLLYSIFLPRLRYRYWRFSLMTEELVLERGIWNHVRTIVPLRRIQHLDVSQDILENNFDLGKLIVHTAGTQSGNVVLPGLRMEEAEQLRDEIKHYINEDVV